LSSISQELGDDPAHAAMLQLEQTVLAAGQAEAGRVVIRQ
jgi:hypothetical protein